MEILQRLRQVDSSRPLFVKVSPDLEFSALDEVVGVATEAKVTGLIATNTTTGRDALGEDPNQEGGLSGLPLRSRSNEVLAHLYLTCDRGMVLIGVGGIFTGEDVYEKIRLGAHLTQVYTGWIYGGPHMVPNVLEELVLLMQRDGVKSLDEVRGTAI
jgi:dihydroorotate dehydrogenase